MDFGGLTASRVEQVPTSGIASEERLEDIFEARIDILGLGNLFQIGRQVVTDFGKRIDLLAIDGQGDLHVIELKKDRTPREVVAQALEYGFWVQGLSFEAIRELYANNHDGEDFDSAFTSHFEAEIPEAVNTSHQLVVVATGMDTSTEQIVEYVRGYGVPINVLFFEYLDDGGREYLARSWLTDPELEAPSKSGGKKQAAWTVSISSSRWERTTSATGTTWSATDSSQRDTGTNTARQWRASSRVRAYGLRFQAAVPREGLMVMSELAE